MAAILDFSNTAPTAVALLGSHGKSKVYDLGYIGSKFGADFNVHSINMPQKFIINCNKCACDISAIIITITVSMNPDSSSGRFSETEEPTTAATVRMQAR